MMTEDDPVGLKLWITNKRADRDFLMYEDLIHRTSQRRFYRSKHI
jgi:hypothetical protein